MRCKKEEFVKCSYFHIYNRSLDGLQLFLDESDYNYFLKKLIPKTIEFPASVFAYCLMPNHFHFLIRQNSDTPIYRIFNDVNNSYVSHYNFKYKRKGSLYQGDLQHKRIKDDKYLVGICQYIHYNPVKANLVDKPEDWEYSNYLEWIGLRNNRLFDDELLRAYFSDNESYKKQIKEYESYAKEVQLSKILFNPSDSSSGE